MLVYAQNKDHQILIHIGDGFIFGCDENDHTYLLSEPENGEERNTTYFLSSFSAFDHIRIQKQIPDSLINIIMCSDGLAPVLYEYQTRQPAKAVQRFSQWLRQGNQEEIQSALDDALTNVFSHHTLDDMSIILINRDKRDNNDK